MDREILRPIVLAVLGKISNLLIQDSVSLLGFEDHIQFFETRLRRIFDICGNVIGPQYVREDIYDIEDWIDELIIISAQRRNRDSLMMRSVLLSKQFCYVLALIDLTDTYRLLKKFELIKSEISSYAIFLSGLWRSSFGLYDFQIGRTIVSPVISKFEALATQKQLSPGVRRQARWLRDEFKSLQDFLENRESNCLSEEGMAWIEEVSHVCYLAENVVGLFLVRNEKGHFKSLIWSPNFISQYKLAKKMAQIKDKICDISSRRYEVFPITPWSCSGSGSDRDRGSDSDSDSDSSSFVAEQQLDTAGFDEDVDAVTAQLLKDDQRCLTISIVGIQGIGKTSLAKLIYNSQAISDHFPHRIWVSGEAEVLDTTKQILGLQSLDRIYEDNLRDMVIAFFVDKKSLIVIDDSNAKRFWSIMEGAFRDINNGTRIIFTVQDSWQTPPITNTNFAYRLHLRSEDESWALFTHLLKINIPRELDESLKNHILRKCGGLPKVILKLVELLSQTDATLEEWSKVLEQLNQDEEPWSKVLEKINKYLPLYLRRCLFYFGLFPVSYKIPARRLIALWVAEGLGRHQQNHDKSPEYVAEACLTELVNSNMVQVTERKLNGKIKTCCLPEALRLHWFSKAKEANFLEGHNNNTPMIRRLADHLDQNDDIFHKIHGNSTTSLYSCYRDVVSFLSFDTREESKAGEHISNFLDRCISSNCFLFLWVLDLERVYKPKLPKAVGQLTQLKYLGLRSTYLEMLPMFIDKLLNLQTLDLKRTCINTLPITIWKMQKLRHLFLDESFHSTFVPPQEDNSLVDLQTLRGVVVDEETPVRNGLDTVSNITKLGLKCKIAVPSQKEAMPSQLVDVAKWVTNLKYLQSLKLKSFDELSQPSDLYLESLLDHKELSSIYFVGKLQNQQLVSKLPQNLVELTLSASRLVEDPLQSLNKLLNLRILKLFSRSFTGKKMFCSYGGFPKLEVLKFWELEMLEEWNVEERAMPSLKDLEIRNCENLKMLPDALQHINSLREVKLTKLPMLSASLKDKQGEYWKKIAHVCHLCIED